MIRYATFERTRKRAQKAIRAMLAKWSADEKGETGVIRQTVTASRERHEETIPRPVPAIPAVLVVSYPKSGRTWLRVMLDDLGMACAYSHDRSSHKEAFPFQALAPPGTGLIAAKFVFLHRDPRDTAVSGYFQASKRIKSFKGDISAFLRDPRYGVEKVARFNLAWLAKGLNDPAVHRLSYEQLTADPQGELGRLVAFIGSKTITSEDIDKVAGDNTFENMRQREASGAYAQRYGTALKPVDLADPESFKVRRGRVGGFRDSLGKDDIAFCDAVLAKLHYWEIAGDPHILSA